jgi:hypothetical protein
MRSSRRQRAPGSGDRSPAPRCAAAPRPALRPRAPTRGSRNGQLANLSHQRPLKSHRHKPRIPPIHEPSTTAFSRNPVSHNGLTHEYGARNFAQLRRKRCQQPHRAHETRPPDAPTRPKRRPNTRTRPPRRDAWSIFQTSWENIDRSAARVVEHGLQHRSLAGAWAE